MFCQKSITRIHFGNSKSYPNTNQILIEQGVFFSWDTDSRVLYWFVLNGNSSTLTKQAAADIHNICFMIHDKDLNLEFNIKGQSYLN